MPDVLLELARRLGPETAQGLPWNTYEEMLKAHFLQFQQEKGSITATDAEDFWKQVQERGGWWGDKGGAPIPQSGMAEGKVLGRGRGKLIQATPYRVAEPEQEEAAQGFPFHFYPYASQMFYDGSLAHLPWLQETPDPLSTVMWGTWVEINPLTAARLGIEQGDLVEVASPHGKLQAPALVSPGIAPDVVAMPVGQGHKNFTRYASARGANPLAILSPTMIIPDTGGLAWAATRVKLLRVGKGNPILFAGSLREKPFEHERR
jgi:anaerobic selenocysteine-containing dehydrogenase